VALCVVAFCAVSAYGKSAEGLEPKALDYAGIHRLKQIEPNLTGAELNIGVVCRSITYLDGVPQNDYRPNIAHDCFKIEQFTFHDDGETPAGISEHSTAVCSILFGNEPNGIGSFVYEGAFSKAQAHVYEFWHFLKNYVFPNTKPNADIVTVSIGSPFEDWWSRGINALAEQHGLIVIAGIGNGLLAHDPPLYPAAGDNCLAVGLAMPITDDNSVGECNGFSLAQAATSSCGPTDDMRCKPDIIAPGNCLVADSNKPGAYKASGSYSSFATPVVTGAAGLLIQKAKAEPNLAAAVSAQGGNCVVKAILMNSAKKMPYWHKGRVQKDDDHHVPLDWMQGAGMVDAIAAHRTLTSGQSTAGNVAETGWDLGELSPQASVKTYRFKVGYTKVHKITATVVWNRHYQQNYPFEELAEKDVDIRLELWAVDTENPQKNYLLDYSDSKVDNVEHIYCKADPNYTNYELVVSYAYEPNAPAHNYGLAWSVNNGAPNDKSLWLDINTDGKFDNKDVAIVLKNVIEFARQSTDYLLGDVNEDGAIDFDDARIFMDELRAASEIKTASNQE
jgi:hypothetical protein